ncbi:hypothetical protein [Streptomyces formicae]|uniref:hypothetical protein n=1 Tax=Streptomyces formicae TaxID=1616117 RepID=UPI000D1EFCB7|nr:hypothetical protein [Streptomyces formicae]
MPSKVVEYLAGQLGIADASGVKRYAERRSTEYEHAAPAAPHPPTGADPPA